MRAAAVIAILLILDGGTAHATECGELRAEQARLKTALAFDRSPIAAEGKKALAAVERKLPAACAPRKVTIAALPIAYLSVAPGNLSRSGLELGDGWGLTMTTQAGAASGIVFADPVTLEVPLPLKWTSDLSAHKTAVELLVAVAVDAQLTVEEPAPGKGSWRIDLKGKPELYPLSKIRACAAGKPEAGKLSKESCHLIAKIDPMPKPGAQPERGRAQLAGEWQYGWHATVELADEELSLLGEAPLPARLDLHLDLSAPLPGISDGKKLAVTFEGNRQPRPAGATFKLGQGCGDDEEACEKQRFAVEVWWDRVFGVPYLRLQPAGPTGKLTGKVTDRLARPMAGQRVVCNQGGRRAIAVTDSYGEYRFDGLGAGETSVVPVGRNPANIPKGDEKRTVMVGLGEAKAPIIFLNKPWE